MIDKKKTECVLLITTPSEDVAKHWTDALCSNYEVQYASNFMEAERETARLKPSVVLFDVTLPPVRRFDKFISLLRTSGSSRIILLTDQPDPDQEIQALKCGARGYAHRDLDVILLRKAVEVVRKGELWVSRSATTELLKELAELNVAKKTVTTENWRAYPPARQMQMTRRVELDRLTKREQEIAYLVGNGSNNKEIANLLKISEATVKAHLSGIYHKLGLLDRLSLALFIAEQMRESTQLQYNVESRY